MSEGAGGWSSGSGRVSGAACLLWRGACPGQRLSGAVGLRIRRVLCEGVHVRVGGFGSDWMRCLFCGEVHVPAGLRERSVAISDVIIMLAENIGRRLVGLTRDFQKGGYRRRRDAGIYSMPAEREQSEAFCFWLESERISSVGSPASRGRREGRRAATRGRGRA